jgi:hypothetical protein
VLADGAVVGRIFKAVSPFHTYSVVVEYFAPVAVDEAMEYHLNGYKVVVEVPICRTRAPNASYPYVVVTTRPAERNQSHKRIITLRPQRTRLIPSPLYG